MSGVATIDRYLFSEVGGPFLFGMIAFVIIGMVDLVFTLVDMFINNGVPFLIVFKLLIFKIPAILVLFFPMAVLFAVFITLIRIIKDSEMTVLRTSGISQVRIILPILVFSLFVTVISFLTNEVVVPWANTISESLLQKISLKKPPPDILENTFFKESENRFFYIKKIDKARNLMYTVMIYELTGNFPRVIMAKQAAWNGNTWTLQDGTIHSYSPEGIIAYQGKFENMNMYVEQSLANYYNEQKSPIEMSTKELKEKIASLKKSGVGTDSLQVAYHMKYSMPTACLVFAIVGITLILLFVKTHKEWWGVIAAVMIGLLSVGFYFFVMATSRSLARAGVVSPVLGAWGPNLVYVLLAILLISSDRLKEKVHG